MTHLYLFTEYFPFGIKSEVSFLKNEIQYLIKEFDQVIVVPYGNYKEFTDTSHNYKVDLSLSQKLYNQNSFSKFIRGVFNLSIIKEFVIRREIFKDKKKIKRLVSYVARAKITEEWFREKFQNYPLKTKVLLYTYWNIDITLGLAKACHKKQEFTIISRVHGHDLYENKLFFGYIPCYREKLALLDKVYTISNDGKNYLNSKFPDFREKIETKYLGVGKANAFARGEIERPINIISCSYSTKLKRIDLILKGIFRFVEKYNMMVNYVHFGDGEMQNYLKQIAKSFSSNKLRIDFAGFVSNNVLLDFYANERVDLFITASASEGLPVTLQEAQSYGIPVIGTNVNGIPEIVNDKVGKLISEDPTAEEIADAIYYVVADERRYIEMKRNSIENWENNFNAESNYNTFAKEIHSFANQV